MSPPGSAAPPPPEGGRRTVVVVGGGIAGLAAAWELTGGARRRPDAPEVVVLEAAPRLGGALATAELLGTSLDVGPDSLLARRPEGLGLCAELGLEDHLEAVGVSGAAVWARGKRRVLPAGLVLAVPTAVLPVARSGILGPLATARLASDRLLPRPDRRGPLDDRAIGPLVARKLGRRVVDQLVDPLVGGIHAGGVRDMSAAAVFPALLQATERRGSFLRALRRVADAAPPPPVGRPAFVTLREGLGSLPDTLAAALEQRGVRLVTGTPVRALRAAPDGSGAPRWQVALGETTVAADGVILGVPAGPAASLLAPHAPEAAQILRGVEHASVCVVTFAFPAASVPAGLEGTGLLVPRTARVPPEVTVEPTAADGSAVASGRERHRPFLTTACTYLDRKWPHLARDDVAFLRVSTGRYGDLRAFQSDDGALRDRLLQEVAVLLGIEAAPRATQITRWPEAFPQYQVHHLLRVAAVETALARLPGLAVAGATYHGIGVPACIGSGRRAAGAVLATLGSRPDDGGGGGAVTEAANGATAE